MLKDQRKRKFVDLKTQALIALEVMLHALILPILIIIFLSIDPFSTMFSSHTAEEHFIAAKDLLTMNLGKWPLLILLILFVGFLSVVFSHHIAGPGLR